MRAFRLLPYNKTKEAKHEQIQKMSHTLWFCEYHLVWCPKYRYRVLEGKIKSEVESSVRSQTEQQSCEVVELNVQHDHVHLIAMIPPKKKVSDYMGRVKGKAALRVFSVFRDLRQQRYWGNHLWAPGYCVGTVGLNEEQIRKYVKYQEERERQQEEFRFGR